MIDTPRLRTAWLLLSSALGLGCSPEYTLVIDLPTLQAAVSQKFPLQKGSPSLLAITLSEPVLSLPGGDRVGLALHIDATAPDPDAVQLPPAQVPEDAAVSDRTVDALLRLGEAALQVAAAPTRTYPGTVDASGRLRYEPEVGAFYLEDLEVERLSLEGMSAERVEGVRSLGGATLGVVLERWPVYTLEDDRRQRAVRMMLKDVHVEPDGLHVTLGR